MLHGACGQGMCQLGICIIHNSIFTLIIPAGISSLGLVPLAQVSMVSTKFSSKSADQSVVGETKLLSSPGFASWHESVKKAMLRLLCQCHSHYQHADALHYERYRFIYKESNYGHIQN